MNATQTILLVDDSENDLILLRTAFSKAEYAMPLQEVHNGEEAISYLKGDGPYADRNRFPMPSMVLLDLNMPMKSGFDVLCWVRGHAELKRPPVIILTASMRAEDVERAYDLGANAFLVKPSRLEDLVAMIRCLRDWTRINRFPPLGRVVQ